MPALAKVRGFTAISPYCKLALRSPCMVMRMLRAHGVSKRSWGVKTLMQLRHGLCIQVQARRKVGKVVLFCRRIDLDSKQRGGIRLLRHLRIAYASQQGIEVKRLVQLTLEKRALFFIGTRWDREPVIWLRSRPKSNRLALNIACFLPYA